LLRGYTRKLRPFVRVAAIGLGTRFHHQADLIRFNILSAAIHHNRPKRLLVVINPYGGRKKAVHIYEKQVEPLFTVAGIQTNLLITERPNHAYDYISENGWQEADGIVCVGGDGTLSEVVNAIIIRTARNCGVNMNNVDVEIPPVNIRVGVIPGGSTDTVLYSLHGSSDIVNAVVHIILGEEIEIDESFKASLFYIPRALVL
jgi:ceramide kinase